MTTLTREQSEAYDSIDQFLRNNLGDDDYAEYSVKLEKLIEVQKSAAKASAAQAEQCPQCWASDGGYKCLHCGRGLLDHKEQRYCPAEQQSATPAATASEADKRAYAAGWTQCAKWADRVDLISDIDSTAYNRDRDNALQRERQQGADAAQNGDPWTDLLAYVLQDDLQNRLTPRVIDIAYSAFMRSFDKNPDDGGPTDWYNDTRPMVIKAIEKMRKDLIEEGRLVNP